MTTVPATVQGFDPLTTQRYEQSLTQQQTLQHAAWIGIRVEALLSHYWTSTPPQEVKKMMLNDWMDVLKSFTPKEIETACKTWLTENDRKKPKPADIYKLMVSARTRYLAKKEGSNQTRAEIAKRTDEERDRANDMVREAGFSVKRMP